MGALEFADQEWPYSIWAEQNDAGGWNWELIDQDGETSLAGRAADRAEALEAARLAADQVSSGQICDLTPR